MNRTGLNDHRRTRRSSLWSRTLAALAVIGQALAIAAPPAVMAQAADETPILAGGVEVGRHFTQTGGGTGNGYDVREPYYGAMVALGGTTWAEREALGLTGGPLTPQTDVLDMALERGSAVGLMGDQERP